MCVIQAFLIAVVLTNHRFNTVASRPIVRQWLSNIPTDNATKEELLEEVFSVGSMLRLYNMD
jgi:hypothetical protein